jgi:uncharacterized membrane protein YccC
LDYFAATLGGVLWGGLIAVLVPHSGETALLFVLLVVLAPLAFIVALYPRHSVGPVTAAIVVLIPQIMHTTPIASALERVVEVPLGGVTGLCVSFVLVPSSTLRMRPNWGTQLFTKSRMRARSGTAHDPCQKWNIRI